MKVIKKPSGPKPYQFTCTKCRAELEAEPSDVKRWVNDPRDGNCAIINCPICKHSNYIDASLLQGWQLAQEIGLKTQN